MLGIDSLSFVSSVTLLVLMVLMGLFFALLFWWQVQVLRGMAMENPDGSVDDWHDQEILYGMAAADILIACPLAFVGILVMFLDLGLGTFILALVSFFLVWVNFATTRTSLRFRRSRLTMNWFIVFPLGAILGTAFLIWAFVHMDISIS